MGPVTAAKVILNRLGIGATPMPVPDSDRVVGGRWRSLMVTLQDVSARRR
jgi:hypothetical protein